MNLTPPTDAELVEIIREEAWFHDVTTSRIRDELRQLSRAMADFDVCRCALAARTVRLLGRQHQALDLPEGRKRQQTMEAISDQGSALRDQLCGDLARFDRRRYQALGHREADLCICDEQTRAIAAGLVERFEKMRDSVGRCIAIIDSMVERGSKQHQRNEHRKERQPNDNTDSRKEG